MRAGADYFVTPAEPAQRRYEALRSYFVDGASAAEVGARFGYSPASVHQLAAELRAGRTQFFLSSKPGPRGPRKSGRVRDQVLALRAEDRSVTDIAERVSMDSTPVSAQSVWAILHAAGIERLGRSHAGPSPRLDPLKAAPIGDWPAGAVYDCDHAGLYVLLPALVELGIDKLISAARYPGTKVLSPFHSLASLLLVKCSRTGRAANAFPIGADPRMSLCSRAWPDDAGRSGCTRARPGSIWTSTRSATTETRSPSRSTTSPTGPNGPEARSPCSPRTTPRQRWCMPTRT